MKIQNVIAITGSIINIFIYFFESLSHFVGGNMQKLEIIQNTFDLEGKKRLSKQLTLNKKRSLQSSAINLPNINSHDLNEIQFKFDSSIKKMNKNLQSSLFNLTKSPNISTIKPGLRKLLKNIISPILPSVKAGQKTGILFL